MSERPRTFAPLAALAAALLVAVTPLAPAGAHDGGSAKDPERIEKMQDEYSDGQSVPLFMSPNMRLASTFPDTTAISGCFAKTAPYFYVSSLDSISVFDTSDPVKPQLAGTLDNLTFENEAMNCGERKRGGSTERFVLVGVDLHQASSGDISHVNTGDGQELMIVDVTDPTQPRIRGRAPATTSTHTVACVVETDCRYAYSAGDDGSQSFSIFDLTDLDQPREVDSDPATDGVQPFHSPTAAHKWNFDAAGYGVHTGYDGSSIFDVSDPLDPQLVTTTGEAGKGTDPEHAGYNDFIHHNSFRPNARAFEPGAPPSFDNGNILLVTEEDYLDTDCATAGSFQAWHVTSLSGEPSAIKPLDKVELADLGSYPLPEGAFCSAHWFDYHPSGIVTIGFYGGGTQLIDVRDPENLEPYGHAVWGASEVWDAYWMPVYNKKGTATGKKTNIVYSVDLVRGLDVYTVDLPGTVSEPVQPLSASGPLEEAGTSHPVEIAVLSGLGLVFAAGVRRRLVVRSRS